MRVRVGSQQVERLVSEPVPEKSSSILLRRIIPAIARFVAVIYLIYLMLRLYFDIAPNQKGVRIQQAIAQLDSIVEKAIVNSKLIKENI